MVYAGQFVAPSFACCVGRPLLCRPQIWDIAEGVSGRYWPGAEPVRCLKTLRGHKEAVPSLRWALNGEQLVSAGWDRSARVWATRPPNYSSFESFVRGEAPISRARGARGVWGKTGKKNGGKKDRRK